MTYKEWMEEVEVFSTRRERMIEDIKTGDPGNVVEWVMAAYKVGYDAGHYDGYGDGFETSHG